MDNQLSVATLVHFCPQKAIFFLNTLGIKRKISLPEDKNLLRVARKAECPHALELALLIAVVAWIFGGRPKPPAANLLDGGMTLVQASVLDGFRKTLPFSGVAEREGERLAKKLQDVLDTLAPGKVRAAVDVDLNLILEPTAVARPGCGFGRAILDNAELKRSYHNCPDRGKIYHWCDEGYPCSSEPNLCLLRDPPNQRPFRFRIAQVRVSLLVSARGNSQVLTSLTEISQAALGLDELRGDTVTISVGRF